MMVRKWTTLDIRLRVLLIGVGLVGAYIAWYLGSPLFIDKTVNEGFPAAVVPAQAQPTVTTMDDADAVMPAQAQPTHTTMGNPGAEAANPMPAGTATGVPIALGSGQFGEIDAIHKGQGAATLFKLPDGQRVLRFENFKVTNGPDLYVYLSGHPAPRDGEQVHQDGFEVARLKGNIGDQNYELPGDLDLAKFKSVVIYCKQFSVVFSTAELVAAS